MSVKKLNTSMSDILLARKRIEREVLKTPLVESYAFSSRSDSKVWLKLENLQKTGSFKLRGALNKISSLPETMSDKGVITASSGNHAQGVAYSASLAGISALIVVPQTAPETKRQGIKRYGAELVVHGNCYDEAEEYAFRLAKETGRIFIHASEDNEVVAGQGTVALEALLEKPDFDAILVPAGGGGLICGTAVAAKTINPAIEVIGIQSRASPPWYFSFKERKLADVTYSDSLADGLHGGISQINLDFALGIVDRFILVEEEEIASAMYMLAKEHHYMTEGAGAVGIAALLHGHLPHLRGKNVLSIITGGNVDAEKLFDVIDKLKDKKDLTI